jgi:hypothetical protein
VLGAEPKKYRQRRPDQTVLYRVLQQHLESFLEHAQQSSGKRLPKYVENEFRRYLECGLHAHGFARAVCETCGDELFLPFSCKLRGICPSCNTRRMPNTAAHLIDHVIAPDVTLRQWALTVPFELRLLLAAKPEALSAIGRMFLKEIQRWQRQQAQVLGFEQAEGAAVSFCQRFGSSLNLNVPGGMPAARERLLRYCARPPLALERLSVLEDGRICYRIKDSDQIRLMTPTQFLARLAALVPPPRHPLVRFYGVWAPHSRWRSRVVQVTPKQTAGTCPDQSGMLAAPPCPDCVTIAEGDTASSLAPRGVPSTSEAEHTSCHPQAPSVATVPRAETWPREVSSDASEELRFTRLSRLAWATLYQRVFDIDPLECASCGSRMRFVEVIEDVDRARSELRRRNLPAEPPPLSRARSPDWDD